MAAVGVRRPHTSMGFTSPTPDIVDPDCKLGEDVLTTGFKDHLENFYLKATPEDRARCLELLTSIDIGNTVKEHSANLPQPDPSSFRYQAAGKRTNRPQRPKTAMSHLGPRDPINPYATTYKMEYTAIQAASGQAERPGTARHQVGHDLSEPLGSTTYDNEYYSKKSKTNPIRTGTASGNRRNNPHPAEAFMVWKLPKSTRDERRQWDSELTDDVMDRVMRGKITSTYQQDYLGVPQGFQVKSAFDCVPADWKTEIPFSLDSSTRHTFQKPDLQPELKGNTVRYGCNRKKHQAAAGVVPTISNRYMDIKTRTTYEREYNSTNGPTARNVRDMGRQLGANSLEKHLHGATYKDKEILGRMIKTLRPESQEYRGRVHSRSSSFNPRSVIPPSV